MQRASSFWTMLLGLGWNVDPPAGMGTNSEKLGLNISRAITCSPHACTFYTTLIAHKRVQATPPALTVKCRHAHARNAMWRLQCQWLAHRGQQLHEQVRHAQGSTAAKRGRCGWLSSAGCAPMPAGSQALTWYHSRVTPPASMPSSLWNCTFSFPRISSGFLRQASHAGHGVTPSACMHPRDERPESLSRQLA